MKKVITIIGARPQFIKHAPVDKIIKKYAKNITIHTGQHFDENMSHIFFTQLGIDSPQYQLHIHGGTHGEMTGNMMIEIEKIVLQEKPDFLLVYGDTNSTLAGALVASKLNIPLIHIESGLRSGDKRMPEEVNRILTDHISDFLLCPTDKAINNLQNEGIIQGVLRVQDPMFLTVQYFQTKAREQDLVSDLSLSKGEYYFATFHRPSNTDTKQQLVGILELFGNLNKKVLLPIHPRTKQKISDFGLSIPENIIIIDPCGYVETLHYIYYSSAVITDSGGLQKEAYILGKNIFTMRDTTEWIETVESGRNILLLDSNGIIKQNAKEMIEQYRQGEYEDFYGKGESLETVLYTIFQ